MHFCAGWMMGGVGIACSLAAVAGRRRLAPRRPAAPVSTCRNRGNENLFAADADRRRRSAMIPSIIIIVVRVGTSNRGSSVARLAAVVVVLLLLVGQRLPAAAWWWCCERRLTALIGCCCVVGPLFVLRGASVVLGRGGTKPRTLEASDRLINETKTHTPQQRWQTKVCCATSGQRRSGGLMLVVVGCCRLKRFAYHRLSVAVPSVICGSVLRWGPPPGGRSQSLAVLGMVGHLQRQLLTAHVHLHVGALPPAGKVVHSPALLKRSRLRSDGSLMGGASAALRQLLRLEAEPSHLRHQLLSSDGSRSRRVWA